MFWLTLFASALTATACASSAPPKADVAVCKAFKSFTNEPRAEKVAALKPLIEGAADSNLRNDARKMWSWYSAAANNDLPDSGPPVSAGQALAKRCDELGVRLLTPGQ